MNEKHLSKICLSITLISFFLVIPFGLNQFIEIDTKDLLENEGNRGIVSGRVDAIISEGKNTIFLINDGNIAKVFYPKTLTLKKNDFVSVYGESKIYQGKKEIHAYYVVSK